MATSSPRKLSKAEREILINALDMLAKSQERAARAATGEAVRVAYVDEAAKTNGLRSVLTSGELEL